MKKKIIIFGAGGHIGYHLANGLAKEYEVIPAIHSFSPPGIKGVAVDITNNDETETFILANKPAVVVNCAALTNADYCENNQAIAQKVNVEGTRIIAKACEKAGARLIQYSTDLLFDGRKGMYMEEDEINPLNYYAKTKAKAESVALECNKNTVVLRTAIVFGPGSRNGASFFEACIEKIRKGKPVKLFTDQYRSFFYIGDSARVVTSLIESDARGLFHVAGPDRMSRYDFMMQAFESLGLPIDCVEPIRLSDLPDLAPRPADCSMNAQKIERVTGFVPSSFEKAMEEMRETW